jgi:hypothetical protein
MNVVGLGGHAKLPEYPRVAALRSVDLGLTLLGASRRSACTWRNGDLLTLRLQAGGLIGDGRLGPPVCVLFEGWDAEGKGGAIRRLTAGLDPRHVRVAEFATPSESERRHHFLWRFWPVLPGWGGMGRARSVLVWPGARRAGRGRRHEL